MNVSGAFALSNVSSSGELNIVGPATLENTLHVTGAISGASGITGSSLRINDTIFLNANGKITGVNSLSASAELFAGTVFVNDAGTNSIKLLGTGEISGSGDLNIVGAATLESTLHVSGAITTAAGVTASAGISSSYGFMNSLSINAGGTKDIVLAGDGTGLFAGKLTVLDEISGSGVLNIVGATTLESTLNVSGAITTAAGLTASAGVSSSYGFLNNLGINQGGTKNIQLGGDGVVTIAGGAGGTTCLSASGDVNSD
mgnify:FL=1